MKLSKAQSRKLKSKLPVKWSIKLHDRLKKKGVIVSEEYIKSVVYGKRGNLQIIEEAILLKTEHQNYLKKIKTKI